MARRRKAPRSFEQNIADRIVSYFAPETGLKRLKARAQLSGAGSNSGYIGGRRDRRAMQNWYTQQSSVDADVLPQLPDLRSRSRDLSRNVPIATGAINTNITNIVGEGIKVKPQIDREYLGISEEKAEQLRKDILREYKLFMKTADFRRLMTDSERQRLALRSCFESGDVCIVRRYRKDKGDVYGTKLQIVEADRLSNPGRSANNDNFVDGVEVDGDGVPVAYHFANRHPFDVKNTATTWKRIKARSDRGTPEVLHIYSHLRPGQTRGIPYMAPIIEALKQLGDYADAEVKAAVISAMFTVFVTSGLDDEDGPLDDDENSSLAANEIGLGPGAVVDLAPGEEIQQADPKRPNDKFEPFVQAFLRMIGTALELPYEMLIKHFTASYSASRAALEMAWQFFRCHRTWFAEKFCQPIYEWFFEEAVALGRIAAPGFFSDPLAREAYCSAHWIGPANISLDPLKEAKADEVDLNIGTKTREEIVMERTGGSFEHKHEQLVREKKMRDRDGLTPTSMPEQSSTPPDQGEGEEEEDQRDAA